MTKAPQKKPTKPSDERGDFRSMYSVLFDSPEYEELSLAASHLLVTIKHSLGPAGIGVLEVATLQRRSKLLDQSLFYSARDELVRGRWITIQHRIWWLRNGLRFEPSMSCDNENHVRGVQKFLNGLPKLVIANQMAAYYRRIGWALNDPFPGLSGDPIPMGSGSHRYPIEIPSSGGIPSRSHGDPTAITEPLTETLTLTEPLTESDSETESESRAREGSATPDGWTPNDTHRAFCLKYGLDVDLELVGFDAWNEANDGEVSDATFTLWLSRSVTFGSSTSNGATTNGRAHDPDPPRPYVAPYKPPADPEVAAEDAARVIDLVGALKTALKNDPTPAPRKKRLVPLSLDEQKAAAAEMIARERALATTEKRS